MSSDPGAAAPTQFLPRGTRSEVFERLIDLKAKHKDDIPALHTIAAECTKLQHYGEAIAIFTGLLQFNPDDVEAGVGILECRSHLPRDSATADASMQAIQGLMKTGALSGSQITRLSSASRQFGAIKLAFDLSRRALKMPDDVMVAASRECLLSYLRNDELKNSRNRYERARSYNFNHRIPTTVLSNLISSRRLTTQDLREFADLARRCRSPHIAVTLARQNFESRPDSVRARAFLAQCLLECGMVSEGANLISAQMQDLALCGDVKVIIRSAGILASAGDLKGQRRLLETASTKHPGNRELNAFLFGTRYGEYLMPYSIKISPFSKFASFLIRNFAILWKGEQR